MPKTANERAAAQEATILTESRLTFTFPGRVVKFDETAFYRNSFQSCLQDCIPHPKGVDFIVHTPKGILLMEVKNFTGDEKDNLWRIWPDNKRKKHLSEGFDVTDRDSLDNEVVQKEKQTSTTHGKHRDKDSLDIEIVQKVICSLLGLYGAWTKAACLHDSTKNGQAKTTSAQELASFWNPCTDPGIQNNNSKKLQVVLFLEGEFAKERAKDRKGRGDRRRDPPLKKKTSCQFLRDLGKSITKKLKWLNCEVVVVNSQTYQRHQALLRDYFTVEV